MSYNQGGKQTTFFGIIFNYLLKLSILTYSREDINLSVDALWGLLKPYIDEELMKLWKTRARGHSYKPMMWKVRVIMLTLYKIEALPSSNVKKEELVFADYEPPRREQDKGMVVSSQFTFKELMMRYYYLFTDLVTESQDLQAMQYMADLGYFYCSPYVTWEDKELWSEASEIRVSDWQWFREKTAIISSILDREGFQLRRRAIDVVKPVSQESESIEPLEGLDMDIHEENIFRHK